MIILLKTTGVPVAFITNGSLISSPYVPEDLLKADYVSVKSDVFNVNKWHLLNKPHKKLNLTGIIDGTLSFSQTFSGKYVTETMLIKSINDSYNDLENTIKHIEAFSPDTAYIAVPTRPPAYKNVLLADESTVNHAYHVFREHIKKVELLTGYEGNAFSSNGSFKEDILSITAVHQMHEDAVRELLSKTDEEYTILTRLIEDDLIRKLD